LDNIDSADEFIKYVDEMIPNLELLGGALGVGNQAAAIVSSSATPHSKCIRILRAWFDATPEPTWTKFCEKLEVSQAFAHLRSTIEKGTTCHACIAITVVPPLRHHHRERPPLLQE
jgi:hypothetical protein